MPYVTDATSNQAYAAAATSNHAYAADVASNHANATNSKKQAYIVGADWCGYTRKQLDAIPPQHRDDFKYVDCGKDQKNPLCQGVAGFPTMKTETGETCFSGYTADVDKAQKRLRGSSAACLMRSSLPIKGLQSIPIFFYKPEVQNKNKPETEK